ncbi:hypothetical protein [Halobacillus trueperi]|uniref:hypothetical protein n=1 Tax=Halobacillus trueperi TaxID=156205 RepID=UPI003734C738
MFYYFSIPQEQPIPTVTTSAGLSLPVTEGSYCWKGPRSAECVDKVFTDPIEMGKQYEPTKVAPNQKVSVRFGQAPPQEMIIEQWVEDGYVKGIDFERDEVTAPTEKGLYFYYIKAQWMEGDGHYAFALEVK